MAPPSNDSVPAVCLLKANIGYVDPAAWMQYEHVAGQAASRQTVRGLAGRPFTPDKGLFADAKCTNFHVMLSIS